MSREEQSRSERGMAHGEPPEDLGLPLEVADYANSRSMQIVQA